MIVHQPRYTKEEFARRVAVDSMKVFHVIAHWGNPALLLELEAIILRATEPPYNVQIPAER